jgi:hypothetical protein
MSRSSHTRAGAYQRHAAFGKERLVKLLRPLALGLHKSLGALAQRAAALHAERLQGFLEPLRA